MTTYTLETGQTARRWTDKPRTPRGITIHHWGSRGSSFDAIVRWFCAPDTTAQTSAHYVAQGADANGTPRPRVACIVDPDRIAWHAGDWDANVSDIGIECRPEARDADYLVVAELIRRLRAQYGDLPLRPHKRWTSTACPGVWDLDRLDRLARSTTTTPTPTPNQEDDMPTPAEIARAVWGADIITAPQDAGSAAAKANPTWAPGSYLRETFRLLDRHQAADAARDKAATAQIAALTSAVQALAGGQSLSADQLLAVTEAGARKALESLIDSATTTSTTVLEVTPN